MKPILAVSMAAALGLLVSCSDDDERGWLGDGGQSATDSDGGRRPVANDCEEHIVQASRAIPDLLVVLDRSASMAPDGNDQKSDRWQGSVDAVEQVTSAFDDRVHFGLMTFPGQQQQGGGGRGGRGDVCAPGVTNVQIGANTGDDIKGALDAMDPGGYTPTAATLQEALKLLGTTTISDQAVASPKYVLLVTDGDPNCSSGANGPTSADPVARQQSIDAIKALTNVGVQTYVVGYQTGSTAFASTLDQMAVAGGTGQTKHISVASGGDLTKTFETIADRAISCSYQLDAPVDDPSFVLISVAKKSRSYQNAADGWTLSADKRTITLLGTACEQLRAGSAFSVQIVCEPIVGW